MAETRPPSGVIENTTFIGLAGAIGLALQDYVPENWHMVLAIGAPIVGKYVQMLLARFLGENVGAATRSLLPALLAFVAVGLGGCGGQLTVAECQSRVEQAKVAKLGCGYFPDQPDRAKCEASADVAVAAAMLGCEWAERPPVEEPV